MILSWGYPPQKRPDPGRYESSKCACPKGLVAAKFMSRNSAMRKTDASGSITQKAGPRLSRAAWFTAVAFGSGLVMAAGPGRAGDDDEEDDKTFEEKIIEGIMRGIGGTNMENRGIEYRERSPLVVPPKIDLPPPGSVNAEAKAPNWPKD